jgi:3-deoxy-D-manno-octulosonic-acid transferase
VGVILYRIVMGLAFPVLLAQAVWQALRGVIPWQGVAERLGGGAGQGSAHLWLHGASLGELTSARLVIERLLTAGPVIVTCNTGTARAMVAGWRLAGVSVALAPFDLGWALARFARRWQPMALILIESELWPARMVAMRGKPVVLIGGRVSARAAKRWAGWAPNVMRAMLGAVTMLSAQDEASEARFVGLGLPKRRMGPRLMLKAYSHDQARAHPFANPFARVETLLAASTHEGDEGPILDAFLAARAAGRFQHLILAPRHPRRAAEIAAAMAQRGVTFAQRSNGGVPGPTTLVHLADTLGEMDHWYRMAGVTVIGGSFSDRGGHTPYEPAAHGSAIVHGPDVSNFTEAFGALDAAGGAVAVDGFGGLAAALIGLDAGAQADLATRAAGILRPDTGIDGLMTAILGVLNR